MLAIILAVLILILLTKVGIDAAYGGGVASLAIRLGPVRKQLLPKPEKTDKPKKPKKEKKEKPAKKKKESEEKPAKPKKKLDLPFLLNLAKIGLHALNRFRIRLRIDVFHLRFIMASGDPYTTATTYGYVQAFIGMLGPRIRRAFTVKDSRVALGTDFLADKPEIEARLVLTIRIGSILAVVFATGFEFLRYMVKRKLREKREGKASGSYRLPAETEAAEEKSA